MFKTVADHIVQPFLKSYLKKKRTWHYKELNLVIYPGVFHPRFFFSSRFLAEFISTLNLTNKTFCEPGAGSGLVSLMAHQQGAIVTAFDVHPLAVDNLRENFSMNFPAQQLHSSFSIYTSDLFDNIPRQTFDYIAVNPPYFFKATSDQASKAWYCGQDGEYFEKFFAQLNTYTNKDSQVYMILAQNCEVKRIDAIATKNGWQLELVAHKEIWWEVNFIYRVVFLNNN